LIGAEFECPLTRSRRAGEAVERLRDGAFADEAFGKDVVAH